MSSERGSQRRFALAHWRRVWALGLTAAAGGVAMAVVVVSGAVGASQPPVNLGDAQPFAILAGSQATNTGSSTINGDIGVPGTGTPATNVTGFSSATVNGTIHNDDTAAKNAESALTTAEGDAASRTPATNVSGTPYNGDL
jgi:hypothetical protein